MVTSNRSVLVIKIIIDNLFRLIHKTIISSSVNFNKGESSNL